MAFLLTAAGFHLILVLVKAMYRGLDFLLTYQWW